MPQKLKKCTLCPRECHVDRASNEKGICAASNKMKIARYSLHLWEEPILSGTNGSGTIFFSHCNLKCVFCQNCKISCEGYGKEITEKNLYDVMARLADGGAENINLVTPTHYAKQLLPVLKKFKHNFNLPIVYNCGGYESVKMLKNFEANFLFKQKREPYRLSSSNNFITFFRQRLGRFLLYHNRQV